MATVRKRIPRARAASVSAVSDKALHDFLLYGTRPAEDSPVMRLYQGRYFDDGIELIADTWAALRDKLLPAFLKKHPGEVPYAGEVYRRVHAQDHHAF